MTGRTCCFALIWSALLLPASAAAQSEATSFDELQRMVKPGQRVVVTELDGRETKGAVTQVSADAVVLAVQDGSAAGARTFSERTVSSVRRTDSVWNGLLIGLGAGIAANEVFVRSNCGPRGNDDECAAIVTAVGLITFVPGGAVIGALIDKFTGNTRLYRSPTLASLALQPIVARNRTGLSLSVRF
jgi:hypothetical protein